MQHCIRPKINHQFTVKKIEVLFMFDILDRDELEEALIWCRSDFFIVLNDKKNPRLEAL